LKEPVFDSADIFVYKKFRGKIYYYIKKALTVVIIDRKMVVSGKFTSVEELEKIFAIIKEE
jgi:hypothetical protein